MGTIIRVTNPLCLGAIASRLPLFDGLENYKGTGSREYKKKDLTSASSRYG